MLTQPQHLVLPLAPTDLAYRLTRLGLNGDQGRWAVALSGGPDSLALTALLASLKPGLLAFIVDHGLRAESKTEAQVAAQQAQQLGVETHILSWEGLKPTTGILARAREARYKLLIKAAWQQGVTHLFLAHHEDDQYETVALRSARGSDWRGLAGMPDLSQRAGLTLVRPLLDITKDRLIETCLALGLKAAIDPSNLNPKYARARLRLEDKPRDLALWQTHLAAKQRRQSELMELSAKCALHEGGAEFKAQDHSHALLSLLLQYVGQGKYPASQEALHRITAGQTLSGCKIIARGENVLVVREPAAIKPLELSAGAHEIYWDKRWQLSFTLNAPTTLAPLGRGSWRCLQEAEQVEAFPSAMRPSLPAIWQGGSVVKVLKGQFVPFFEPLRQYYL